MVYVGGCIWLIGGVGFVVGGESVCGGQDPQLIDWMIIGKILKWGHQLNKCDATFRYRKYLILIGYSGELSDITEAKLIYDSSPFSLTKKKTHTTIP